MEIKAINNNDMLKQAVLAIREHGIESDPGNAEINTDGTRFLDGVTITVSDIRDRWLSVEGRNSSAIAAIGETFWVLSGRNDLKFLSRVLPRAANFSDDGFTWRAAYGPRLYAHGQLDSVINRLRKNPNTRQAYLTIYDPALDSDAGLAKFSESGEAKTKDMVCNLALLFAIVEGRLNLTVINRSQDVLWGMSSINFIEFSILQEVIAGALGVGVGQYKLFSNNLHYYNNEVSQKQLGKITKDTEVVKGGVKSVLCFEGVTNQNHIRLLFSEVLEACETGKSWASVIGILEKYKAERGLMMQMSYCLWCRLNGVLINPMYIGDDGLFDALKLSSVDKKYVDWREFTK
ncbi:thymidylate synthase [Escherichia coli]|uniref:thymidylate synthase n=1 Tax=Escherichia coli TaxID=562 RepID=UPI001F59D350|nr:thymidylate synthase [Escherichia coli]MCI2235091.1 thymidylate synthase [Escherichia coli]